MTDLNPYATAVPLLGSPPSWIVDKEEQQRIASYALYESIYWGAPDTFKLTARGAEDKPIYVPSGKVVVETMHRYLAPKMTVVPDPLFGTPQDQLLAQQVWTDFSRRERVYSKFNSNKRYGLIRGDWAFMLSGDGLREPTTRVSFLGIDPGMLFPIYSLIEPEVLVGWHIGEIVTDEEGKLRMKRLTYRKVTDIGGPSPISVEQALFELDNWGGPGMNPDEEKRLQQIVPLTILPAPIDSLPIYTIPNFETPGMLWGSSEMRGLERIMGAVNQSISDEEITLAMDGLGVYFTDAGAPVDETSGEDIPWNLGPGRVVEVPEGKTFGRVNASGSVHPYQEHLAYLHSQMDEAASMNPAAKGTVDVAIAESGISLALQMAPLFARAEEKELTVTDKLTQMFFDIAKWFVAYEGSAFNSLVEASRWVPIYGDKLPPNNTQALADLMTLQAASPKIVSTNYVRDRLRKIGYDDMPPNDQMDAEIQDESAANAAIQQDAFGVNVDKAVNAELNATGGATP